MGDAFLERVAHNQQRVSELESENAALSARLAEVERKLSPNELAHASTAPECCGSWAAARDREKERAEAAEADVQAALTERNQARARTREVEAALEDLVDRQDDYPTDLTRDAEWGKAFSRARRALDGAPGPDPGGG